MASTNVSDFCILATSSANTFLTHHAVNTRKQQNEKEINSAPAYGKMPPNNNAFWKHEILICIVKLGSFYALLFIVENHKLLAFEKHHKIYFDVTLWYNLMYFTHIMMSWSNIHVLVYREFSMIIFGVEFLWCSTPETKTFCW